MLITLSAVNAIFIAWTTVLEARHPAALTRALGATPKPLVIGLSVAQLLPAALTAVPTRFGAGRPVAEVLQADGS